MHIPINASFILSDPTKFYFEKPVLFFNFLCINPSDYSRSRSVIFCVCSIEEERGRCLFGAKNPMLVLLFAQFLRIYVQGHALKIGLRHRWKVVGGKKKTTAPYLTQKFCAIIAMEAIFYFHHVTLIFGPDLDVNKVL